MGENMQDDSAPGYDASEQDAVLEVFKALLRGPTKDGGRKRAAGTKDPWWRDQEHWARAFHHISAYLDYREGANDSFLDPDSGTHALVHAAWRFLAIAYQDMNGQRDPQTSAGSYPPPDLSHFMANVIRDKGGAQLKKEWFDDC